MMVEGPDMAAGQGSGLSFARQNFLSEGARGRFTESVVPAAVWTLPKAAQVTMSSLLST
jgi:hypothetical protein